jgi:diguanylate cyclase (GGDEF)-like protein
LTAPREPGPPPTVARLVRMGRDRQFARSDFEMALGVAAEEDSSRGALLRELFVEWAGVSIDEEQAVEIWERVIQTVGKLETALGQAVSLQTALLHELHTRLGLVREPRMLSGRELSALRVNAITDPLTGLYNRRFLYDHLQREISRAERVGGVVSLMMMDLQGFKSINDRLGHPVGDTMLVKTARVIRDSLRAVDAGCRYGGDEFVAVLPNTTLVGSLAVAERIRERVSKIQLPRRIGLQMGLHYGVATFPSDGRTIDFLIRTVDQRLYDCRRYNSDPRTRRHPRFAVQGLGLRLLRGGTARQREFEVKDIGYGGLAFIYPGQRAPSRLEGELVQEFASDTHHVSMKPVSVRPLSDGRSRVGCAYVH